jgi:hypothetical protein
MKSKILSSVIHMGDNTIRLSLRNPTDSDSDWFINKIISIAAGNSNYPLHFNPQSSAIDTDASVIDVEEVNIDRSLIILGK